MEFIITAGQMKQKCDLMITEIEELILIPTRQHN